jgi:hypothetical protein
MFDAVLTLVLIAVLWVAISRALAWSLRAERAISEPAELLSAKTAPWRSPPENRSPEHFTS